MADTNFRIPNLPTSPIVDKEGKATDDEIAFRQTLISQLQANFGPEGNISPTQTNDLADPSPAIRQIQNNRIPNPVTGAPDQYTCGFGRMLYDATNNRILISIDGGAGVPAFMQVTLAAPVPPV